LKGNIMSDRLAALASVGALALALPMPAEAIKIRVKIPTVSQVIKDTGKAVGGVVSDVAHTVEKGAQDTGKTVEKAAHDTGKTAEKAAQDTGKTAEKAAHDTGKTLEKAAQDTGKATEKAVHDTGKTLEKASQDTAAETKRAGQNVEEFGRAVGRFVNRVAIDTGDNISDAEQRVREGKIVDAFWHLAVDPVKDSEERAAKLAQESTLANAAGQVAASVYGGPGGAAAYAAWYTYRTTGDAELALRVGIISGATSYAMSSVNPQPSLGAASAAAEAGTATAPVITATETVKKAAMAGAIGGLAVAASGGDADAIRDGFLKGGGMILVQDGFKAFTGQQGLYAEGAERPAFCSTSFVEVGPANPCAPNPEWFKKDASGKMVLDMSKVPPNHSYVGSATNVAKPGWPANLYQETGGAMNAVAKVPGMNAMSILHDQWVISWDMTGPGVQATILPAIVVTYMGTEAPIQSAIQKAAADKKAAEAQAEGEPAASDPANPQPSFVAYKGEQTRSFFVAQGTVPEELACIVVYERNAKPGAEDFAPWYAVNDPNFCGVKANELAETHVKAGWTVLVR
jgi:hypothetical protein